MKFLILYSRAFFSLNGKGELTGSHYIEEVGKFSLPITITNTHACGIARDATIRWAEKRFPKRLENIFLLPVSAETYDGFLNDINGSHISAKYVEEAIDEAVSGEIEEGSVGGGTGMKSFEFKSGSGTASRVVKYDDAEYTVGIFVQANFGSRTDLNVLGVPVGLQLSKPKMICNSGEAGSGFMNIATAFAGKLKGGAAKVSVISSALFGSISGSASANVASTGMVTLPAMIKLN